MHADERLEEIHVEVDCVLCFEHLVYADLSGRQSLNYRKVEVVLKVNLERGGDVLNSQQGFKGDNLILLL